MKTIRELREARGESQMQLADAIGVTHATIVDYEQGVAGPSIPTLRALTEHFGVRDDEIDLEPNHEPTLGQRVVDALDA